MVTHRSELLSVGLLGWMIVFSPEVAAQSPLSGESLRISRTTTPIVVDGELSDEAWRSVQPVERWYEINPGDNVEPSVRSVGYVAYDDRFFYLGMQFDDPDPGSIRAPYVDRDRLNGNVMDFGGVVLDTRNDGHSAVEFFVSPRGVQYDAVTDDAADEDSSPDFFWDSAARITERGWTLEIRVPFSSLRYGNENVQTWGILLYRNYPREFRYQIFSARLPRGGNCFVCRANTLVGLDDLPSGGHVVAAPYVSATRVARSADGLGSPLVADRAEPRGGLDVKWTPTPDAVVDLTLKPDFSQIEADTAQITANERFALSFPEKRPFFLEGVELLSTPIRAVHTRTITAPQWGTRLTGKQRGLGYTVLAAEDTGGGSLVVPGPDGSAVLPRDKSASVLIARAKYDFGGSFVGVVTTDRENRHGGEYNRVVGPDFQWRFSTSDVVTGQWLLSATQSPDDPDVGAPWAGRAVTSHAADLQWRRDTTHLNLSGGYKDFGNGFRADSGFVPQVGYRELSTRGGWTVRPNGFLRRLQMSVDLDRQVDRTGALISRHLAPTVEMNARWNGFMRFHFSHDRVRSGDRTFARRQVGYAVRFSPSLTVAHLEVRGTVGEDIDFVQTRLGRGATVNLSADFNPTQHLSLSFVQNQRWLHIGNAAGSTGRLFLARVSRVRATYTFTANSYVRVVSQYTSTVREPSLYRAAVRSRSGALSGSALFAYKLNWQSVLFVGYGDDRELSERQTLESASRQFFVKVSYALQR